MYQCVNAMIKKNEESPDDTVDYVECSTFDMKGYIPARLLNMVIANEGSKEFKVMYTHLLEKFGK